MKTEQTLVNFYTLIETVRESTYLMYKINKKGASKEDVKKYEEMRLREHKLYDEVYEVLKRKL